jgi:transposase
LCNNAHLDVHRLSDGAAVRFANATAGFRDLAVWLGAALPARVVYEPTGPYHAGLEKRFAGKLPLCKVNPLQARRFAQSKGMRAKTDKVDARMLAVMGAAFVLEPDTPMSQNLRDLKELRIARMALIKDRTRLKNRLQTLTLAFALKQAKARLALVSRQLRDIDAEISACIAQDNATAHKRTILRSIPGIGAVTAAAILIECPEVGTMTKKQIASLSVSGVCAPLIFRLPIVACGLGLGMSTSGSP